MIRTYAFVFDPDPDGGFVVTCPALPGLVTHGDTIEKAREMAQDAADGYLATLIEDGVARSCGTIAMVAFSLVWRRIERHAGEVFRQIRGGEFTYSVRSGAVIPDRTNRMLPRSHFEKACDLLPVENTVPFQNLQGPSYLYAILMDDRIRNGDW